jgi:hypothetical protein
MAVVTGDDGPPLLHRRASGTAAAAAAAVAIARLAALDLPSTSAFPPSAIRGAREIFVNGCFLLGPRLALPLKRKEKKWRVSTGPLHPRRRYCRRRRTLRSRRSLRGRRPRGLTQHQDSVRQNKFLSLT